MDLPVWQALYEELGDKGFLPVAVAFDTRGPEAARPWIEGAKATYPCLVDEHHVVAELYGMVNIPRRSGSTRTAASSGPPRPPAHPTPFAR